MQIDLILPLSMILGLVAYGLIAKWYLMPLLSGLPRERALVSLLLLHCFRFIGLPFLIPGVTSQPLDPRFANPAAYGDLLAALLAFLGILALRREWRIAIPLVWLFNVEGTLDLLSAVTQGLRYTEDGALGATFFIPAMIVPLLLVTHYIVFVILLREGIRRTIMVEMVSCHTLSAAAQRPDEVRATMGLREWDLTSR